MNQAALAGASFDLVVLGAGPGGYSAAFRAADLGVRGARIERYPTLGGVCLNVGCIPSKALLHVAAVMDAAAHLAQSGVRFAPPQIDIAALRAHKEQVVGRLTAGLAAMARQRKITVLQGVGSFVDPTHLDLRSAPGTAPQRLEFRSAIIAAGSQAMTLPFMPADPRIGDATVALALPTVPRRMLVIGGGIIGLEMATVYSALGSRIDVVEMSSGLMPGTDRDLVQIWLKRNAPRFDHILLNTRAVAVAAQPQGLRVRFEGESAHGSTAAPAAALATAAPVAAPGSIPGLIPGSAPGSAPDSTLDYDFILVAVGRRPNGKHIGAEHAGVAVDARGFIATDRQMRTNVAHIFAIGDIAGPPLLAHKAVHEGHVAAEAAAGLKTCFEARVIPAVAYTDPEIAWVGLTEDEARAQGLAVRKGLFPWVASGRAIANGRDEGCTKLLFDATTHRLLGGAIVGTHAGDLIGELALAIEMGADARDIGKTIHPHPTLGESIAMAAEVAEGVCTDLPPPRQR